MTTLIDVLAHGAAAQPALVAIEGPTFTYAQLRGAVETAAEALTSLGIGPDDRIATVFGNGPESVIFFLAAATVGAAAPLNPAYKEDEFRFYLEDTQARALVVPPGQAEAARRARPPSTILIEAEVGPDGSLRIESGASRRAASARRPEADAVALVLHTSGTTSRPKCVPLRHRHLAASIDNIVATYRLTEADVSLCVMPLFHVHGLMASTLASLRAGGTVVVPPRFNAMSFWAAVEEHGVSWYSAVPTMHQMLLMRAGGRRPEAAAGLRFIRSCSSALPPSVMAELESTFGAPVLNAYGMTEASHQMASSPLPPEARIPGTVGRGTGVEVAVLDGDWNQLGPGLEGEVAVRGPNITDGYQSNPAANADSFRDGWFRTGDQGVLDAAGYLTLVGRLKEMINRGGEKIAPGQIDEVLLQHPAVAEAVAFAVPHPTWGEEVAAAVVLRGEASEKQLIAHCRERLAAYKVPRTVHLVASIPRTATGKIQRRQVAAAFAPPR